jgi:nicotinate-nucleotide adenylyltransferase
MPQTIGILGGTFDPVHNGHLAIATAAIGQLELDLLLLVPNARSPLKASGPGASFEHRVAMLQLAIAGGTKLQISEIEGARGATSYTIDTLMQLSELYCGARFVLIVGADALADFHLWRQHEEIRKLAQIAYVGRSGIDASGNSAGATRIDMDPIDISSTAIRDRVRRGLTISGLVPPAVAEFIAAHHLYSA